MKYTGLFLLSILFFNSSMAQWSTLLNGMSGGVYAFAAYDGGLIIGGHFIYANNQPMNYITKWDDQSMSFSNLDSGINQQGLHVLKVYNGELYAGGYFALAGN